MVYLIGTTLLRMTSVVFNSLKQRECHSEPFAHCHSERSEESDLMARDKLREESATKCHPERSEGSLETLRFAQGDTRTAFFGSL
jgi:hypothetical protein